MSIVSIDRVRAVVDCELFRGASHAEAIATASACFGLADEAVHDAIGYEPVEISSEHAQFIEQLRPRDLTQHRQHSPYTGFVDCGECPRISTGCRGTCMKVRG